MRDRYKEEMDRLEPRREALERLYAVMEGEAEVKKGRNLSLRAAVVLVCAALMVTAAAAAAPAVWEGLLSRLGAFAPYAQTIEGTECRDQGIRLQVLSALSDDLETRVYLSVQDVEGGRLDECLTLKGRLVTGELRKLGETPELSASDIGTGRFKLLSYDPERKTALFSASVVYEDQARPGREARLAITEMGTQAGEGDWTASCASVAGEALETLPAGEEAQVIFKPGDLVGYEHLDAALPSRAVVLAPEQNPAPLEGTRDMWVSSMGFAGDGCFHIRLGLREGVRPEEHGFFSPLGAENEKLYIYQQTLVEGGMDIVYPLLHPEDLELIRGCEARFYGPYTRPGTVIEGTWTADFQLEYHPSRTLDWTGELAGRQVRQVRLSPLSATMHSDDPGGFHTAVLYAVRKDGSTVAAEPGTGRYCNASETGEPVWEAFNTWKFEEPVDLEEVTALTLKGETIPVG